MKNFELFSRSDLVQIRWQCIALFERCVVVNDFGQFLFSWIRSEI